METEDADADRKEETHTSSNYTDAEEAEADHDQGSTDRTESGDISSSSPGGSEGDETPDDPSEDETDPDGTNPTAPAPANDQGNRREKWQPTGTGKASGQPTRDAPSAKQPGRDQSETSSGNKKKDEDLKKMNDDIDEMIRKRNAFRKEWGIAPPGRGGGGDRSRPRRGCDDQGRPICHICKEAGHFMRDCPQHDGRPPRRPAGRVAAAREENQDEEEEDRATVACLTTIGEEDVVLLAISRDDLVFEEVTVNGKEGVRSMVDTGASVSVITPTLVNELDLHVMEASGPRIRMANGAPSRPQGSVFLEVETAKGLKASGKVSVMDLSGLPNLLLGNNFLQQFRKMTIDYTDNGPVLTLGALMEEVEQTRHKVTVKEECVIPARAMVQVEVNLNIRAGSEEELRTWVVVPATNLMEKSGLSTGHAVVGGWTEYVTIINLSYRPEYLSEGAVIGFLEEVDEIISENERTVVGALGEERTTPLHLHRGENPTTSIEPPLDFEKKISKELSAEDRESVLKIRGLLQRTWGKNRPLQHDQSPHRHGRRETDLPDPGTLSVEGERRDQQTGGRDAPPGHNRTVTQRLELESGAS